VEEVGIGCMEAVGSFRLKVWKLRKIRLAKVGTGRLLRVPELPIF
jgi:hypothetical protein